MQLAQVVRGAAGQPFAFARGEAAPGHHGHVLAGLELPERWFHDAGPQLVVVLAAEMQQAPPGAGDDLVCGDDELAVVAGHVALVAVHHPRRGRWYPPAAQCRPDSPAAAHRRGGVRGVSRRPRLRPRLPALPAAPGGACCPRPSAGRGPGQPLPPFGPAGQRSLTPRPEPGDGRVIGAQPASDHPVPDVPQRTVLDHPARPLTLAVPLQQQRHHHLRIERPRPCPSARYRRRNSPRSRPPPHPAQRRPDRPQAATRACPPASARAGHAAGKESSAT